MSRRTKMNSMLRWGRSLPLFLLALPCLLSSLARAAAPVVNSFNPTGGGAGAAITITGANFSNVTEVRFGAVGTKFTIDSPTQITAYVPPMSDISSQQVGIDVVNADGTGNNGAQFNGGVVAGSKRWIGAYAGDGNPTDWFDPLHWTPTGVPGPGDHAVVNTGGGGLTISGGDVTVDRLTLFRVNLTGNSNLTVSTKMTCVNSTMGGVRTITLPAGSETECYGVDFLGNGIGNQTIFDNSGTFRAISGQCFLGGQAGNLATLNNLPGGVVEIWDTEGVSGGGAGVFNNTGTVTKAPTVGTASITVTFNNNNVVTVPAGTLNIATTTASTNGEFHAAPGALLQLGIGSLTVNAGTLWTGAVTTSGGVWHINGDAQMGDTGLPCTLGFNTLMDGAANFTVFGNSTLNWTGNSMEGTGALEVLGGGKLNISNGVALRQRTLNNAGTVTITGSITIGAGNLAVFNNQAPGTLDIQGNTFFSSSNSGSLPGIGATINNAGTMLKSGGGGTAGINIEFNNSGVVNVQNGILAVGLSGTAGVATGAFNVLGGTALNFVNGTYNLNPGSSVNGAGTCSFTGGTTNVGGGYNMTTTNISSNGNVNFNGTATTVGGTQSAGTLSGTGTFNITGIFTLSNGTIEGSGATAVAAGGRLNVTGAITHRARTLNNSGLVVWTGGSSTWSIGDSAIINNLAGATFDIQTDADMPFFGSGAGFNNSGTLRKSAGSGETSLSVVFFNSGTLDIQTGTLKFGSGSVFTQNAGSTLLSGGNLASFNTINLQGGKFAGNGTITANVTNNATLALGSAVGTLAINGNYVQNAGGTLELRIGGTTPGVTHDVINISGSATLGGTLKISLVNGFTPNGDSFTMMNYASRSGNFTTFTGLNVGGGKTLTATANATNYVIADPNAPVTVRTISGRVANGSNVGIANITLTRTNSTTTATTNVTGNYTFTNVVPGSYTVTPTSIGFTYSPSSRTFTVAGSNVTGIDFTATVKLFTISGRVANTGGTGMPNLLVARNGTNSVLTNASGNYTMTGVTVGTYTIAPVQTASLNGVAFIPPSYTVNVTTSNLSNINFTATFTVTGRVSNSNGVPLPNMLVTRSAPGSAVTVVTDANGNFKFSNVRSGSYSIALQIPPSQAGMTTNPTSYNVTVGTTNLTNINFTAFFVISGKITNSSNAAMPNVLVRRSTATSSTTVLTDANGNYSFTGVRSDTYTITPTQSGKTFNPASRSVTVGTANMGNINFIGSP